MANIRIKDLPSDTAPSKTDTVPIDLGTTRHATVEEVVLAGRPTATKTEAEAGTDNKKAMTPLAVKQAIDAQTGMRYVPVTRRVDSGTGLSGGQELTGDVTLSLNSTSVASLAKADSAVQSVNGKSGNSVTITPADVGAAPSSIVADVNANTAERHSHTNKAILDATTASFLATEKTKLSGIESGAQVNTVTSVAGKTGAVTLSAADASAAPDTLVPDINANTTARHTHSNKAILDATTASFLAAEKTKLAGIAAGAQVNTVTSVAGKTGAVSLVKADVGLGNVDNTSDASKPISTATQTALNAKANSSVTVSAGTGLTGGGNLTANRTVALNSASIVSLGKADTALQAPGGTTGQILAKSSNTTNDVGWVSSESATAVSYGPQTLTEPQKTQARQNIQADKSYDSIASVAAATVPAFANAIRTNGYYAAGDGGAALYKRNASDPSHAGKVHSADGVWWELAEQVIRPEMFGIKGDGSDETALLQQALDCSAALRAKFVQRQKIYISPVGITVPSGTDWEFLEGAGLELLPHNSTNYQMIRAHLGSNDITLIRPKCNGRRDLNSATTGEHGMGLSLRGCKRVTVIEPEMNNCWGDGYYVGSVGSVASADNYTVNEDVTIIRPKGVGNRRQGMSIVSGINLLVSNPIVTDTDGTAPQDGIDIEPNNHLDVLNNVRLRDVYSARNKLSAVQVHLGGVSNSITSGFYDIDVDIDGLTSEGDYQSLLLTGLSSQRVRGKISVSGLYSVACKTSGIQMRNWCYSPELSVNIYDPIFKSPVTNPGSVRWTSVITVVGDEDWISQYPLGGITIHNPIVLGAGDAPAFVNISDYGRTSSGRSLPRNVSIIDPKGIEAIPVAGIPRAANSSSSDKYGVWAQRFAASATTGGLSTPLTWYADRADAIITLTLTAVTELTGIPTTIVALHDRAVRVKPPEGARFIGEAIDKYIETAPLAGAQVTVKQVGPLVWDIVSASRGLVVQA